MGYPYKYIVKVSNDDAYSQFSQEYCFLDVNDAMKRVNAAKEVGDRVALYRIIQHENFK